jgi:hypothetical protein
VSAILPGTPLSQQDAERVIQQYVDHYNNLLLPCLGWLAARRHRAAAIASLEKARQKRPLAAAGQQRVEEPILPCLASRRTKKQPVPEWTPKRAAKSGN